MTENYRHPKKLRYPRSKDSLFREICEMLEATGFLLVDGARNGETYYYSLPGRPQKLRVSLHKRKSTMHPDQHLVVASITIGHDPHAAPGMKRVHGDTVMHSVIRGVGSYMLRSSPEWERIKEIWNGTPDRTEDCSLKILRQPQTDGSARHRRRLRRKELREQFRQEQEKANAKANAAAVPE